MTPDRRTLAGADASATQRATQTAPTGVLLAAGPRAEVDVWVAGTVVPVTVVPGDRWTTVLLRGPSAAEPPYDDGPLVLASRALAPKAGPGLGFFVIDDRAVLTVHPRGRRRATRWVVWEPESGLLRPPGLELAGPAEVVTVAGAGTGEAGRRDVRDELVELLHETHVRPARMLQAVMATLGLPGARLLENPDAADAVEGATTHTPDRRQVGWFDDAVRDSVRLRHELGAPS